MQWLDEEAVEQEGASALDLLAVEDDEEDEAGAPPEAPGAGSRLRAIAARGDWPLLEPAPRLALTPRVY
jgi:hypothetical protein